MRRHADQLPAALDGVHDFVTLVAALYAIKYTGVVNLHLLNGQPQQAELGRPHVIQFPHPATPAVDKSP